MDATGRNWLRLSLSFSFKLWFERFVPKLGVVCCAVGMEFARALQIDRHFTCIDSCLRVRTMQRRAKMCIIFQLDSQLCDHINGSMSRPIVCDLALEQTAPKSNVELTLIGSLTCLGELQLLRVLSYLTDDANNKVKPFIWSSTFQVGAELPKVAKSERARSADSQPINQCECTGNLRCRRRRFRR